MAHLTLRLGAREVAVRTDEGGRVTIDDHGYTVTAISPGVYLVSDGDQRWRVAVADAGDTRWVSVNGQVALVEVDTGQSRAPRRRSAHAGAMTAPMPATVVKILVEPGQTVAEGATVLVLEAMKMELPIRAPRAGVVKSIGCSQGQLVQPGVVLVELEHG
jgi:3-methylcrotonyl-CoA carboxylase alpha subunit